VFLVNLLKGFFDPLFDLLSLFVQVLELSEMFHPGLVLSGYLQFFLDGFSDKLAQGNTTLSGDRLGPAEEEVGNFEGGFHEPILPYLWETGLTGRELRSGPG